MSLTQRRPYTFDRVVRIIFSTCILAASLLLINQLRGVLIPFIIACLGAYMMEPLVQWNKRWMHLKSRFIPVMFTLIEVCSLVAGFLWLFIPYLTAECSQMAVMVRDYATKQIDIPYVSDNIQRFIRQNIDLNHLSHLLSSSQWEELIKKSLNSSWKIISSSVSLIFTVVSWLVVILYLLFIMLDYEKLALSFKQMVPVRHRARTFRLIDDIKNAMNRYFRGQTLIAFLVGVLFSIGFVIIGLPMGVILGLFIGLLNLVPYLQVISLPITALLCLVWTVSTGGNFWLIFGQSMGVYVVVQCIQDLILTPKIMGKTMGLNPAIILLSLSIWGSLLGFIGLIIALPLTTLLIAYYNEFIVGTEEENATPLPSDSNEKSDSPTESQ